MKKITLEINGVVGSDSGKKISEALNSLSGIVAADVVLSENKAYAYCGDQLEQYYASNAVRDAGYSCRVVNEEYITDVEDYKKSLGELFGAPVSTILQ